MSFLFRKPVYYGNLCVIERYGRFGVYQWLRVKDNSEMLGVAVKNALLSAPSGSFRTYDLVWKVISDMIKLGADVHEEDSFLVSPYMVDTADADHRETIVVDLSRNVVRVGDDVTSYKIFTDIPDKKLKAMVTKSMQMSDYDETTSSKGTLYEKHLSNPAETHIGQRPYYGSLDDPEGVWP